MNTSTFIAAATILLFGATAVSAAGSGTDDGPGFQQCRPDLIEGSVEWNRDRISRTYEDMQEALGIDQPTRERLIDILNDRWMAEHKDIDNRNMQDRADAITVMLRSVQAVLGNDRMEEFFLYMHGRAETYQYQTLKSLLPTERQLSPEQKTQLMKRLRVANRDLWAYHPVTWPGSADISLLGADDRALVDQLRNLEYADARARKVQELNERVERDAAAFLSPDQLEVLRQMHQSAADSYTATRSINHPPLDPDRVAYIRHRVSKLPRQPFPEPGLITVRLTITVDDDPPVVVTRTLSNDTATSIDFKDLIVEVTPRLYQRSLSSQARYFSYVGGDKLELPTLARHENIGKDGVAIGTGAIEGVRRGYIVKREAKLLK